MTPESHRKICDLYHLASELAPAERSAFLDEACGGDEALRREVESLLAARDREPAETEKNRGRFG